MTDILSIFWVGYDDKGGPVHFDSPVDQLMPISETLVGDVDATLRNIVQIAIERSLSKFPTLKQAVETKVVNTIFDTKHDQTIQFIRQFLEMQKKSIDVVFAPVPTPHEMSLWESFLTKDNKHHPSMTSKMMSHMKDLGKKLYPEQLVSEMNEARSKTHSFANHKVRMQNGIIYLAIIEWGWVGYEEFCRSRRALSTEAESRGG